MLVVGLTGDVGAGKSTVGRIWKEMGASVIDADALAKELWTEPDVLQQAKDRWGTDIVDPTGRLVPSRVASIIFESHDEYRWLCKLLHPRVRIRMESSVESLEGWVVVEIPLLFEGGVPWWVDMTVYVVAPMEARVNRNAHRNWDLAEIERRESCLLPREDKIRRAHLVIENTGTLDSLKATLTKEAQAMKSMASITEIFFSFGETETARTVGSLLSAHKLAADLSLSTSQLLDDSGKRIILAGFCIKQKLPLIRKLLEQQNAHVGPLWTRPVRHMDRISLQRLAGELS